MTQSKCYRRIGGGPYEISTSGQRSAPCGQTTVPPSTRACVNRARSARSGPKTGPDHERGYVALDDRAVSQREPQSETMERRGFVYSQEAPSKKTMTAAVCPTY